jgi:photosystem II stability/assembly factor-like uncharacterized protein
MMFIRASGGFQQLYYSKDKGQTWSPIEAATDIPSPITPASIARIPSTGDLLLVWNNNGKDQQRSPLTAAISKDEGKTWQNVRNIEADPNGCFCYIAIHFAGENVLLGYSAGKGRWDLSNTNITAVPVSWLYEIP